MKGDFVMKSLFVAILFSSIFACELFSQQDTTSFPRGIPTGVYTAPPKEYSDLFVKLYKFLGFDAAVKDAIEGMASKTFNSFKDSLPEKYFTDEYDKVNMDSLIALESAVYYQYLNYKELKFIYDAYTSPEFSKMGKVNMRITAEVDLVRDKYSKDFGKVLKAKLKKDGHTPPYYLLTADEIEELYGSGKTDEEHKQTESGK
jgi:hypothetical protein